MATLTIRKFDDQLKETLRVRAAVNGHSMEEEARELLRQALEVKPGRSGVEFVHSVRKKLERIGGIEIELPKREPMRKLPDLVP
jgi:plasmid stability protein